MSHIVPIDAPEVAVYDLHGFHPDEICGPPLEAICRAAWEKGAPALRLIHGHGRNRMGPIPFANTNTGYFGLRLRRELRFSLELRQWIKHSTLDCSHDGSSLVKLKKRAAKK